MAVVACLGWGSLIWDPRDLPFRGVWHEDGPLLPIEFTRQSLDGRITLVIAPGRAPVRCLWALMAPTDLDAAVAALGRRERIAENRRPEWVGRWQAGDNVPAAIPSLPARAAARAIDAVVWTALPARFDGEDNKEPSARAVIDYLAGLTGVQRAVAERYIRMAPRQTDTDYRRLIEAELGWTPLADGIS